MSVTCGICGDEGADGVTVTDEDGAVEAFACGWCLGRLVAGTDCALCESETSGEYHVVFPPARWSIPRYRLCSECRKRWVFDNTGPLLERLQEEGIARFGGGRE